MNLKTKNMFNYLVRKLRDRGFSVKIELVKDENNKVINRYAIVYDTAKVAIMITEEIKGYKNLPANVFIENQEVFNKWSQSPFQLPFPKTKAQLSYIFGMIGFMSTKEGEICSNGFFHIYNYPHGMF